MRFELRLAGPEGVRRTAKVDLTNGFELRVASDAKAGLKGIES